MKMVHILKTEKLAQIVGKYFNKSSNLEYFVLFREPSSQENLVSQPWPPVSSSIRDFYCTEQLKSSFSYAFSECEH